MISLDTLYTLALQTYGSMENGRFTGLGLIPRAKKHESLIESKETATDEAAPKAEVSLTEKIKLQSQLPAAKEENSKLKSLFDILLICVQLEENKMSALKADKAISKLKAAQQASWTLSFIFRSFLADYTKFADEALKFVVEADEELTAKNQNTEEKVAAPKPQQTSKESILTATLDSRSRELDEATQQLVAQKNTTEEAERTAEQAKQEIEKLNQTIATIKKSQEDDGLLAERWVQMDSDFAKLKVEHKSLNETAMKTEKELFAYKSSLQAKTEEMTLLQAKLKSVDEKLKATELILQTHRNTNEKLATKVQELSGEVEEKRKTVITQGQRIKLLEKQMPGKKMGGYNPKFVGNSNAHVANPDEQKTPAAEVIKGKEKQFKIGSPSLQ